MVSKYTEKMRMAARSWEENPEMKMVWLRTAERIVEEMHEELFTFVCTMVSNMPTYAVINETDIQDIGDEESYVPSVQASVLKKDLINGINKLKRDGKGSGME